VTWRAAATLKLGEAARDGARAGVVPALKGPLLPASSCLNSGLRRLLFLCRQLGQATVEHKTGPTSHRDTAEPGAARPPLGSMRRSLTAAAQPALALCRTTGPGPFGSRLSVTRSWCRLFGAPRVSRSVRSTSARRCPDMGLRLADQASGNRRRCLKSGLVGLCWLDLCWIGLCWFASAHGRRLKAMPKEPLEAGRSIHFRPPESSTSPCPRPGDGKSLPNWPGPFQHGSEAPVRPWPLLKTSHKLWSWGQSRIGSRAMGADPTAPRSWAELVRERRRLLVGRWVIPRLRCWGGAGHAPQLRRRPGLLPTPPPCLAEGLRALIWCWVKGLTGPEAAG